MKRLQLFLAVIVIVSVSTWALKAQTKPKQSPKTYSVHLTIDQWNSVFNGLESIKNAVKTSNMPAAQSTFISDSLITVYQSEFSRQLNQQLAAEKTKPEVKKDSTSKKK